MKSFHVVLVLASIVFLSSCAGDDRVFPGEQTSVRPTRSGSGLAYIDMVVGTGASPQAGKPVTVHYSGYLMDSTKFDSSVDRSEPFVFVIGAGQVIKGWDEGVMSMKVGGKRKLIIPPHLGYGENGIPGTIPPAAELVFDVELLAVGG